MLGPPLKPALSGIPHRARHFRRLTLPEAPNETGYNPCS
jgi:hypothetical protein